MANIRGGVFTLRTASRLKKDDNWYALDDVWITSSPPIVTSGLVLNLDAANPASYPGSGTTWTNLISGGVNGTLVNGPTYSSVNGGVIVLDGINDYIDVPINLTNTNYTIMGAARYVVVGGRTFSGQSNNWLMGHWSSSTQNYYANGWVSGVGAGPSDTNWRSYATTGNVSGDSWALYVNGVLDAGPNSGGSNDVSGGIGMDSGFGSYSAGDRINCCQDTTGINRSARVEIYVR